MWLEMQGEIAESDKMELEGCCCGEAVCCEYENVMRYPVSFVLVAIIFTSIDIAPLDMNSPEFDALK